MVHLVRHDLEFILKQIKIAEAHSSGTPLSQIYVDANGNVVPAGTEGATLAISNPLVPYGLRTVDGSLNNLSGNRDDWGSADQPFPRITDPYWRDEDDDAMPHAGYVPGDATIPNSSGPLVDQNNNYGQSGSVVDADPRLISNLIVDQTLGNPAAVYAGLVHAGLSGAALSNALAKINEAYAPVKEATIARAAANAARDPATGAPKPEWADLNQAALQKEALVPAALAAAKDVAEGYGIGMQGNTVVLPNVAPDEGLSAPYNSWFTLFGQFFDHGLDLVAKKGGTIYIPLSPDDPLYNPASPRTNFMVVTRTDPDAHNTTTPWVDQNQTYGSTASKQLFMREYEMDDGKPVSTGDLLEGARGLATWADVKKQALQKLGFELTDADVGNIPLFHMDSYGEFIRGPSGLPQIIAGFKLDGSPFLVEGNLETPVNPSAIISPVAVQLIGSNGSTIDIAAGQVVQAVRTEHAFLDDIAHAANIKNDRGQQMYSDADGALGTVAAPVVNPDYVEGGAPVFEPYPALNAAFNATLPVSETNPRYIAGNFPYLAVNSAFKADQPISATNPLYVQSATPSAGINGDFNPNLPVSATNMPFVALNRLYDDELLDAHYITGDGRGNENIGLTAVHHVFHSEHNRLVEQVKELALSSGDLAFLNEWLREDIAAFPTTQAGLDALKWDGERLFQAARFTNEMEYQHLVFEEFARKVQPDVDAFVFNPQTDIDPAIFAEFAHVVYRFGHSMLNETVDSTQADGTNSSMDLFDAFLNPLAFGGPQFDANGEPILNADGSQLVLDHDQAAGAIVRGMTAQHGNEIDEFVTHVLRNQLVGIPLDLAAINIARGRETGIPPLNEARRQFQEIANGDTQLEAYTSWADFAQNLKNPASIVNFIAAYGTHSSITSATTMQAKRDAAMELVFGIDINGNGVPADRLDFLNARGVYAQAETSGPYKDKVLLGGLELVDLWVGGLAEKKMAFGGMLGSTFSFIFELQLENLQNADRFYYLSRVQGLNLLNELENNSLAKMVLNNTDLGESGYAVPGDIFSLPDHVLYVDANKQAMFGHADPTQDDPFLQAFAPLVERRDSQGNLIEYQTNSDGTFVRGPDGKVIPVNPAHGAVANYIRVNTNDHVLIQGTNGNDHIVAGGGDDSVWGMDGDDKIEAGYGVDKIHGGKGDDIITNSGTDIGEVDMLHGEEGNDVIHGGSGLALIFGNQGQDFIITGPDGKEVFGGTGNDFILGGEGGDFLLGNEGDDWIEAGNGFDTTAGDNSELFFNSTIVGHDVMFAGQNEHDFDAESGDDIMVQGESVMRNEGMWGFDWAIHKGNTEAADSDLTRPIFTTDQQDILRDRFDQVEALSGWENDDVLRGDNRGDPTLDEAPDPGANPDLGAAEGTMVRHELTQAGVDRISGLRDLLGDLIAAPTAGDREAQIAFDSGNILIGGGGSDLIEGRGGDDYIDGDAWLNVRIGIYNANGELIGSAERMGGVVTDSNGGLLYGGKTLDALMLSRTLNPGQLKIIREIKVADGSNDIDTAVFSGNRADYTITYLGNDTYRIVDNLGVDSSAAGDTVRRVEKFQFADMVVDAADVRGQPFQALHITYDRDLQDGILRVQHEPSDRVTGYVWERRNEDGTWTAIGSGAFFNPVPDHLEVELRVVALYDEGSFMASAETAIVGTPDLDGLDGTTGPNVILGLAGDDRLMGAEGIDVLDGGDGDDRLDGGDGSDSLYGGSGDDTLIGRLGDNWLDGGAGADALFGGHNNDTLIGGGGIDTVNFANDLEVYDFVRVGNDIHVTDNLGAEGDGHDVLREVEILAIGEEAYTLSLDATEGSEMLVGTAGADTIDGLGGNDIIFGSAGDDDLRGGEGDDTLLGGAGSDQMAGGLGNDTYLVDAAGDVVSELDGEGTDMVRTTLTAYTLGDNVENLEVYAPGEDPIAPAPFIGTGNALNNSIRGGLGNDTLSGLEGDDVLIGGAGADRMIGGVGNDTYAVDNAGDVVVELADEGTDTVETTLATYSLAGAQVENLTFTGSGSFRGTGNGLANVIIGSFGNDTLTGGDGADTLEGRAGDDTLDGGAAFDTVVYSGNRDDYTITEQADGSIKVVDNRSTDSTAAGDTLRDVEIFRFGNGETLSLHQILSNGATVDITTNGGEALTLTVDENTAAGAEVVDIQTASPAAGLTWSITAGNERGLFAIDAATGRITLAGSPDYEALRALGTSFALMVAVTDGLQTDTQAITVDVRNVNEAHTGTVTLGYQAETGTLSVANTIGNDPDGMGTVTYQWQAFSGGTWTNIEGAIGTTFTPGADQTGLRLRVVANYLDGGGFTEVIPSDGTAVVGNGSANVLSGDSDRNILLGMGGNDTLNGGFGADDLRGGAGNDTYYVDNVNDSITELVGEGTDDIVYSSASSYTLGAHVERLYLQGSLDISGTGNDLANRIGGNVGANTISGAGGDDTIDGGLGADDLRGGAGNDTYYVDNVNDSITELVGEGTDDIVYSSASSYTLGAHVERLYLQGSGNINGTGNEQANRIGGNAGANRLDGAGGDDILDGGAGADTLLGGEGQDTLYALAGSDDLRGGAGNDAYYVDDAGDLITELVGEGTDDIVYSSASSYTLGAHVERLYLQGSGNINGTGNEQANRIGGNAGANRLDGAGGDDILDGGAGADMLTGGAGNDVFIFKAGNGRDTVTDFVNGQDRIQVVGLAGVTQFANLNLVEVGSNVEIQHGATVLVLEGVSRSDLDQTDFIF